VQTSANPAEVGQLAGEYGTQGATDVWEWGSSL